MSCSISIGGFGNACNGAPSRPNSLDELPDVPLALSGTGVSDLLGHPFKDPFLGLLRPTVDNGGLVGQAQGRKEFTSAWFCGLHLSFPEE